MEFIVELRINDEHDLKVSYIICSPWKLFFDGSTCDDGQGIGAVFISPGDTIFQFSYRLEDKCTNNQVEYESLLFGLEFLKFMVVKMWKPMEIHFWWCSKYLRYADVIMGI